MHLSAEGTRMTPDGTHTRGASCRGTCFGVWMRSDVCEYAVRWVDVECWLLHVHFCYVVQ